MRMKNFLTKFIKILFETEKRFDQNSKRMQKFNELLYEYENLSIKTYSPHVNTQVADVTTS